MGPLLLYSGETLMRRTLDIHGVRCRVVSDPALASAVAHAVRHLGLPEAPADAMPPLVVSLTSGAPPALPDAAPTTVHEGGYLRLWKLDGHTVLRTPTVTITVEAGAARLVVPCASPEVLVPELVVGVSAALFLLLRPHGFFPLHAAALAFDGHGLLLVAESDSGKSTTAYNLVRQGWHFLSDDSVLLRDGPEAVEAVGFRRTFGLDVDAAIAFPELETIEDRQPSDPAKRSVPMDALYPTQAAVRCRPRVLLFPRIEDRAASCLEPLTKTDALLGLAAQSALVTFSPDWTGDHLATLGRLVKQASAYRLRAGRDLLDDPARIVELLGSVWPGPLPHAAVPDALAHG